MKTLLPGVLLTIMTALPVVASAAVSFDLTPAGVTIHIGDRDHRGYYWDGYDWRAPKWWQEHHGRHVGEKGPRGYWNGNGWQSHRPEAPRHNKPAPGKAAHHKEPEHHQPMAQRNPHQNDRLAADRDGHHAGGHRPDFQPHG
ncbi:DUF2502 domain-containing protein [Mixta sp. Marseille-Q2659]|uniref:DUF2502 domain-containing protein n=1 Tax=Mixta sp. Marseille-Q2659 TaxID=2736607 RepID=UPI0023B944C4|nr:DUF2502 domain-containing protein [Mixta sp. Marseille-Q2659]